jgi:hypothetical protein
MIRAEDISMTVEQLVREADTHTGEDLGRTVFSEVRAALRAGADRDGLIAVVTTLYDHLGDAGRGEDQDAIAEVLDSLTGFCSPSAAL